MCSKCKGTGSKSGTSMKCSGCKGSGGTASTPFLRALLSHKSNACQICKHCNGTRETISDHCTLCNGEKVVQEKQGYCVVVERGMTNGQEIVFPRERGVKDPDKFIRDRVTFLLQEEEHPLLQRKGDDLILKHTLSLKEALWGFELVLTHLDNRKLIIRANPGEVIKPCQVKVINEEGMPVYQRPCMKRKLYIHFSVDFSLPPQLYKDLESALPPRTTVLMDMELANYEKPTLNNVSIEG
eukprot:TRINITY_DN1729_c0_g1_i1.p1 TRINITY_DN1729_c0_g1~~TRINITY_DN1729_c0_g1_i1.p1  ORF type:complete len:240 (-),score=41.40 TRINITY_DN1729_c0_g1_i1:3603-4322(-)